MRAACEVFARRGTDEPDGGLAQSERLAHFARAVVGNVAHREDHALTIGQLFNGLGDVPGALGGDHAIFRAWLHCWRIGRRGFSRG